MSDTCGPTSGTLLAQYDPSERCWKTSEATSLWALTLSSLTLPTWGGLRDGELYEHPTPERLTTEPGYSFLPTPRATKAMGDPMDVNYNMLVERGYMKHRLEETISLLPTPTASRMEKNETPEDWASRSAAMNDYATLPLGVAVTHMVTTQELGARMRQQLNGGATLLDDQPHPQPST